MQIRNIQAYFIAAFLCVCVCTLHIVWIYKLSAWMNECTIILMNDLQCEWLNARIVRENKAETHQTLEVYLRITYKRKNGKFTT